MPRPRIWRTCALGPLPGRLLEWLGTEHSRSLRHAVERLEAVAQDLELVQERARLLQEEIAAPLQKTQVEGLQVLVSGPSVRTAIGCRRISRRCVR